MINLHVTITTRFQNNGANMKRGLVCVGLRIVDVCVMYKVS